MTYYYYHYLVCLQRLHQYVDEYNIHTRPLQRSLIVQSRGQKIIQKFRLLQFSIPLYRSSNTYITLTNENYSKVQTFAICNSYMILIKCYLIFAGTSSLVCFVMFISSAQSICFFAVPIILFSNHSSPHFSSLLSFTTT